MANKKQQNNKNKGGNQSSNKQQKKPTQVLKSFGERIGGKEVKKFQQLFPDKPLNTVVKYAKKEKDVKLGPNAKKLLKKKGAISAGGTNKDGGQNRGQEEGGGIFEPISAHEANIANIYADADKYVADAYSGAQVRSAELGLEGTKYSADKESEWRQAVAGIEVKGRLDLQPIINAGLEKVANIEAQASRDVADITGKYNVEGIKTRGEFDEKIGKINLAGSMYGLISSAFG